MTLQEAHDAFAASHTAWQDAPSSHYEQTAATAEDAANMLDIIYTDMSDGPAKDALAEVIVWLEELGAA